MPKVTYIGPHTEGVEIDVPGFCGVVTQGQTIDVAAEAAESLLDQPTNWKPAGKAAAADKENQP